MSSVSEAFVGNHFYPALAALYERQTGARLLRLLRPLETGGWLCKDRHGRPSRMEGETLLFELSKRPAGRRYLCLILQMKLIEKRVRRGPYTPEGYPSEHYRFELDLRPDPDTGLSEQELLIELGALDQAAVLYGCGMLLSPDRVSEAPDLRDLRLIRPQPLPADGERHFVFFSHPEDRRPLWDGRQPVDAGTPLEWMAAGSMPELIGAEETVALLREISRFYAWQTATYRERQLASGEQLSFFGHEPDPPPIRQAALPDSLMLFEFVER